jgi:hypothetical protein
LLTGAGPWDQAKSTQNFISPQRSVVDTGRFGSGYKDRPKSDASVRAVPIHGQPPSWDTGQQGEGLNWPRWRESAGQQVYASAAAPPAAAVCEYPAGVFRPDDG